MNEKSRAQTFSSMVILSLLTAIGAGIFVIQFHYSPALLQNNTLLGQPDQDNPTSQLVAHPSVDPLPEGIEPLTPAEIFDARTLSDKINGKAELYLSAGFTRLVSQRFRDNRAADLWLEVFVYDMGDTKNAFSVFSAQRRKDAQPLALTRYAYRTPNAAFMVHGPYYVEIIASEAADQLPAAVKMMAQTFMRNTPVEAATVNETALFPEEGLAKDSIVLIPADAFGYDGFNKIYTAEYEFDDHGLMAYLSHRGTSSEAAELASNYTKFLLAYGGRQIEAPLPTTNARLIEILGAYEIVFTQDSYLAGVREAASIDQANMLAGRLLHRLNEGGNESRSTP